MPNVNDLKQSRFLTQRDVGRPILVTITGCKEVNVAKEGAEEELRWALSFKETEKPMTLNFTNGQIIAAIVGSEETEDWVGHQIVLYKDPNVSYGSKITGGIRCRAPRNQPERKPIKPPVPTREELAAQEVIDSLQESQRNPDYVGDDPPPPPNDGIPY